MGILPEGLGGLVEEGFPVGDDVGVANGSEYSDLVECVFFLFVIEIHDFNAFEGIGFTVLISNHFVHS